MSRLTAHRSLPDELVMLIVPHSLPALPLRLPLRTQRLLDYTRIDSHWAAIARYELCKEIWIPDTRAAVAFMRTVDESPPYKTMVEGVARSVRLGGRVREAGLFHLAHEFGIAAIVSRVLAACVNVTDVDVQYVTFDLAALGTLS